MDARSSPPSGSRVPPGFRFHPTDEELVGYYLRKKIASQKIDLDVIRDIDLYRIEPWDLQDKCRIGYEEQKEWYFFSHKDKKYPTGTRTNRATVAGFWKATGRDKAIYDKCKLIGMRKTLVFYKGRAPHGQKTDWIMHEYRLESQENGPPQEEGWVVCRAFKKRLTSGQTKSRAVGSWDSATYYNYSYEEPSSSSVVDSTSIDDFITRQNLVCKQEMGPNGPNPQFVELPQLESPSLPLVKRLPNPIATDNTSNYSDGREDREGQVGSKKAVTDWRELDKFVASQLSHGNPYEVGPGFESHSDSDFGLLLMQSGREEAGAGPRLISEVTTSDCDIGICIFNR